MSTPKTIEKKQQTEQIGARLKELRKKSGLSLQETAERLNREFGASINKGMISKYENGVHEPPAVTLYCLSVIFGVSVDYLTCRTDLPVEPGQTSGKDENGRRITVYSRYNPTDGGTVDNDAVECIPSGWLSGGHEFFGMKITGSELAPRYFNGDIVIFERKCKVPAGRTGLVSIGGGDAFLCRIVRKRNGKLIIPVNRKMKEMYFSTEQLEESDFRVIGTAVQLRREE